MKKPAAKQSPVPMLPPGTPPMMTKPSPKPNKPMPPPMKPVAKPPMKGGKTKK